MKLYTKTGDDGTTGLFGGTRVRKDHPRVAAYGTVDELNACVGLAAAACDRGDEWQGDLGLKLEAMQSRLFDLGADLATPPGSKHEDKITRIGPAHIEAVERWIDEAESGNAPLSSFILPGGTELAARLHYARTVCRRAEREIVTLAETDAVSGAVGVYLNRASDLLFAIARRANREAGVEDVPWARE